MSAPRFEIGDDLYVRDPKRYGANNICGRVYFRCPVPGGFVYSIDAFLVHQIPGAPDYSRWAYVYIDVSEWLFGEAELDHRFGTPLSQLSGRPGHPGYDRFVEIGQSWGYP